MSVSVEWRREGFIAVIEGHLDTPAAKRLREELSQAAAEGERIVVDVSRLETDDSTGLGILIGTLSDALKRSGDLRLVHSQRLSRIWNITGMSKIIPSYGSQDEALAA